MDNFIKFDMAVELMANKISNFNIEQNDENELKALILEREKIYQGDIDTINKIVDTYEKNKFI